MERPKDKPWIEFANNVTFMVITCSIVYGSLFRGYVRNKLKKKRN